MRPEGYPTRRVNKNKKNRNQRGKRHGNHNNYHSLLYHQNDISLRVQSSGYRDSLLLTAAQSYSPLADYRPFFVRQYIDVRAQSARVDHSFEPRLVVLVPEHDVFQNRSVQQPRPLRHVRHRRASFEVYFSEQTVHFPEQSQQHRRLSAADLACDYRQFACVNNHTVYTPVTTHHTDAVSK